MPNPEYEPPSTLRAYGNVILRLWFLFTFILLARFLGQSRAAFLVNNNEGVMFIVAGLFFLALFAIWLRAPRASGEGRAERLFTMAFILFLAMGMFVMGTGIAIHKIEPFSPETEKAIPIESPDPGPVERI